MERWEVLICVTHAAPRPHHLPTGFTRCALGATTPQPQEQPGQGTSDPSARPARHKLALDHGGAEPGSS